jgi:uncharacterized protein involved in exopolysaccharide biosynthesis
MKIKNTKNANGGYSLIEVIFYVSLFALLSVVILDLLITMTGMFMKTMTDKDIIQSSAVIENISRELKQANNFSFASNVLTVNTKDVSGNPKTVIYTFSGNNIQKTDSLLGNLGNLNTPNASVTAFSVTTITTTKSKASEINLTVKSNRFLENQTEDFENTVILRGSY